MNYISRELLQKKERVALFDVKLVEQKPQTAHGHICLCLNEANTKESKDKKGESVLCIDII